MAIKNKYVLEFQSKGVNKTKSDVDKLNKSQKDIGKSAAKLKAGMAIAGVAIVAAGGYAIKTAANFEKLRTRLNTMYGSVNAGTKAFATFNKIAATTPFAVKNVVEAGASLKAFGMDAEKTIKPVADLAAFMGLDVVDAAAAMGRAFAGGAGAADVLRERGVLELIKSFKGIEDITELTLPEFRTALIDAMEDPNIGIAGSTTALAETFEGNMSNMMDAVDRLAAKMGDSLLPAAKSVVQGITGMINSMIGAEDAYDSQITSIVMEEQKLRQLAGAITAGNIPQELRVKLIRKIQKEYPDFLKNIKAEAVTNGQITAALKDVNEQNKLRIQALVKEKVVAKILSEQNDIAIDYADSYNNLTDRVLEFGKMASDSMGKVDPVLTQGNGLVTKFLNSTGKLTESQRLLFGDMRVEAAKLFDSYKSGGMSLKDYTIAVEELTQQERFQALGRGDALVISQRIDEEQGNMKDSQDLLNDSYAEMTERIKNLNLEINNLKDNADKIIEPTVKPTVSSYDPNVQPMGQIDIPMTLRATGFDSTEEEIALAIESIKESMTNQLSTLREDLAELNVMDTIAGGTDAEREEKKNKIIEEIQEISDAITSIETTAQTGSKNTLSFMGNMMKGMGDLTKDLMKKDSELFNQVSEGASALISAGGFGKVKQLKMQKAMIKANAAKGLIDIWTSPAPSDPLTAAKAVAASAILLGKASQSNQEINKSISEIQSGSGGGKSGATFAQYGMNEIVDGATPIIAGEAGAELVQITPLEGPNTSGPQGQGQIIITGNILSKDYVEDELVEQLRESIRQGYDFR